MKVLIILSLPLLIGCYTLPDHIAEHAYFSSGGDILKASEMSANALYSLGFKDVYLCLGKTCVNGDFEGEKDSAWVRFKFPGDSTFYILDPSLIGEYIWLERETHGYYREEITVKLDR